ncbi:MAG: hypothetical protein H0W72_11685 [Planctomycetes bacterium]|nr:hypothetical protein [Planctomycetota bacterium]
MRVLVMLLVLTGHRAYAADQGSAPLRFGVLAAAHVGRLEQPTLNESSGVVASRNQPGVLWTHNDSGNASTIYAVGPTGIALGEFTVATPNTDWEDIAIDNRGHLYLADFGNNGGQRPSVAVHRLIEPTVAPLVASRAVADPGSALAVEVTWTLTYPGLAFDCEALVVHDGCGWLIDKRVGEQAGLWRFRLDGPQAQVLEAVVRLPIRTPVTGADISSDGRRLAVIGYVGLSVFTLAGDLPSAATATPCHIGFLQPRIEACCFVPGGVLATSEDRDVYLFSDALIAGSSP